MIFLTLLITPLSFSLLGQLIPPASGSVIPRAATPAKNGKTCKPKDMLVRMEWGDMTKAKRREYIAAVQCLQRTPSRADPADVPGAVHRIDDFTAMHANQSRVMHSSGQFLTWHRQFVWLYERALREECGYRGAQPWWDWAKWTDLPNSPLFDGSDTSLSGDGVFVDGPDPVFGNDTFPKGAGGGCAKSGPFKDFIANIGPFDFQYIFAGLPANWTSANPHCMLRDLNTGISERYLNQAVVDEMMASRDIVEFQYLIAPSATNLGPHGGGHFSVGRSMTDFFASPADPAFFFHHGAVDRAYTLWQAMDPATRLTALNGTSTLGNTPDTPEVTLDTVQVFPYGGGTRKTGELMNVKAGEFCYRYNR